MKIKANKIKVFIYSILKFSKSRFRRIKNFFFVATKVSSLKRLQCHFSSKYFLRYLETKHEYRKKNI